MVAKNIQEIGVKHAQYVWIFHGDKASLAAAVFSSRPRAEEWISQNRLSGLLTRYPLNISILDWAWEKQFISSQVLESFSGKRAGEFTCAALQHIHFEDGKAV